MAHRLATGLARRAGHLGERIRYGRAGLDGAQLDVTRVRLRMHPDPVILECGANTGTDTSRFLQRWPTARVWCFEPEPRAAERWRATITSERARLFEVAIADRDGETTFHRSSGTSPFDATDAGPWDKSGSIRRPTGHREVWPWVTFEEETTVPTRSLDSWSAEHGIGAVDLVWADVQGAEGDLVRGGGATLARTRYLYTEFGATEYYEGQVSFDALMALLPGWEVVRRFPGDVLLVNPSAD
ncbi:MAG: FkbM family methyltransferase [Actinomycetota bacterium]